MCFMRAEVSIDGWKWEMDRHVAAPVSHRRGKCRVAINCVQLIKISATFTIVD